MGSPRETTALLLLWDADGGQGEASENKGVEFLGSTLDSTISMHDSPASKKSKPD